MKASRSLVAITWNLGRAKRGMGLISTSLGISPIGNLKFVFVTYSLLFDNPLKSLEI